MRDYHFNIREWPVVGAALFRTMNVCRRFIVVGVLLCGSSLEAAVKLSPFLTSNMVLQRGGAVRLSGWADEGEEVVIILGDQVVGKTVGAGEDTPWVMELSAQKAGALPDLVFQGKNTIRLTHLLAGDVWVCSGQSNMQMPLEPRPAFGGVLNWQEEIAEAHYPKIRLYSMERGGWQVCTPDNVKSFSAAAYFFGRELHQRLDVPIGLVSASVGGTMAELWTPRSELEGTPEFAAAVTKASQTVGELNSLQAIDRQAIERWKKEQDEAEKRGLPPLAKPKSLYSIADMDRMQWAHSTLGAGNLFSSKILPLTPMTIKGVIWYQGESNASYASEYAGLMQKLIRGWRSHWEQGDFPFLLMQLVNQELPPNQRPWDFAALRAAQQSIADSVSNTGMAVGIDIGMGWNGHPPNKQDVGRRLALVALKQVYGSDIVAAGPRLDSVRFNRETVTLCFEPGASTPQLLLKSSIPSGFELAGEDARFIPASAVLQGNTIVLSATDVDQPVAVRYAWANNPPATLFDTTGLPAAPFYRNSRNMKSEMDAGDWTP